MISLANIKIYANKEDLIIDTEMIVDRYALLMNHMPVFKLLMAEMKYEYTPSDLLDTDFHMIINFIDENNPSYDTSRLNMEGVSRFCKFCHLDIDEEY